MFISRPFSLVEHMDAPCGGDFLALVSESRSYSGYNPVDWEYGEGLDGGGGITVPTLPTCSLDTIGKEDVHL